MRGLPTRAPDEPPGRGAGVRAVLEHLHAVDEYMRHARRELVRLLERRVVGDLARIKHDDLGEFGLLLLPGHEGCRRKALGRLRRSAVDLAHYDVLAPVDIDAKLDEPVQFPALWGGLRRGRGVFRWGS